MANAKFYKTSKRHNSTLQPSGSSTDIDVQLKNGSDIIAPVFLLNLASLPDYSMMVFEGRTYFITGISSVRDNLWEISAEVDVLATYKSNILATRPFVLYANTNNTEIIDSRLPAKTTATYAKNYATLSQSLMTGQWKIAVSVTGDTSTATFLLTPAQVRALVNSTGFDQWFNSLWQSIQSEQSTIASTQNASTNDANSIASQAQNITTEVDGLSLIGQATALAARCGARIIADCIQSSINTMAKFFRKVIATPNAMECIKSAIFIPWDVVGDGSMQEIMLGEYATGIQALPVYNPIQHGQISIAIPWQASDWRRNAPYHQIYLYLPFMGDIEISPSDVIDCADLNIYFSLNVMNGALNYRVATDKDTTIGVFSCQTGVSYPIGASNITPVSVGMGVGSAAAAITGAPTLAAAAVAASSLAAIRPNASCVGGGGGGAGSGLDMRVICHTVFHDTNVVPSNPASSIGVPVSSEVTLSILSGFVQTKNASVSGSMTDTERSRINMLLDGGIYIE